MLSEDVSVETIPSICIKRPTQTCVLQPAAVYCNSSLFSPYFNEDATRKLLDLIPRSNAQQYHNANAPTYNSPIAPFHTQTAEGIQVETWKCHHWGGYPNVGKSSLFNSNNRNSFFYILMVWMLGIYRSSPAMPYEKDLQSAQLERGMRINDSPGVVFDEDDHDEEARLRNVERCFLCYDRWHKKLIIICFVWVSREWLQHM